MRDEKEMFDLILETGQKNNIQAVILNGSRTNKNVKKDMFQDYDIVYVVNTIEEVIEHVNTEHIIHEFGEISYMQRPDYHIYENEDIKDSYTWLMQYTDGNRIDLHISTLDCAQKLIDTDSLSKVIYDKDNILRFVRPDETSYYIKKMEEQEFLDTCNEFWWCLNNIGKGLCRNELVYVLDTVNLYIRPMLFKIVDQKVGYENNFKVNVGKNHKFLNKFISGNLYNNILSTYKFEGAESIWESVFLMCDVFNEVVQDVIDYSKFKYDYKEARNSYSHLKQMQGFYNLLEK